MTLESYRLPLRFVCALSIGVSVVSIVVGIMSAAFVDEANWPSCSGVGIWCGVAYVINASLGLALAAMPEMNTTVPKFRRLLIAFQAFNGISFGCAISMLVFGGQTIAYCKNEPAERCVGDVMGILTSNAAEVAIGCVYLVITGANYVLHGLIARKLKCQAKLADSPGCQLYGNVKE